MGIWPLDLVQCHKMASRKLFFNGLSESEDDSQQGSNSDKGVNPDAQVATVSGRGCEAIEPLMFDDEPVLATIGPVVVSRPSRGFLKVNSGSCFQEFDMLKLRYMYQIPAVVEIRAPYSHERVD